MWRSIIIILLVIFVQPTYGGMIFDDTIVEKAHLAYSSKKSQQPPSTWSKVKSWVKTKIANFQGEQPEKKVLPVAEPIKVKSPSENLAEKLEKQLPQYKYKESKEGLQDIKSAKQGIQIQEFTKIVEPGRPAQSNLAKTKKGVPTFPLYSKKKKKLKSGKTKTVSIKVKDIPSLDVGLEPRISAAQYNMKELNVYDITSKKAVKLAGPKNKYASKKAPWLKKKVALVNPPKKIKNKDFGLATPVTLAIVEKIVPMIKEDNPTNLEFYQPLTNNEQNMLAANILLQTGTDNCHLAAGILDRFTNNKFYQEEANFHLGVCAHEMGFYSESTDRLIRVLKKEDPKFTPKALGLLVSHLPREYEVAVARAILKIKNKNLLPKEASDNMNYVLAKGLATQRKFTQALKYAGLVSKKSEHYPNARFVMGVGKYVLGRPVESINVLKELRTWMADNNVRDKHLSSLIAVNLGRINFQKKRYKESHEEYLKVNKNHSLWVQALVEQGWIQLHLNDASGAIGNMYSLHSPYFQSVFIPESFAVRTIGYLNICQYGDAYQTLELMESKYKPWVANVDRFIRKTKQAKDYYAAIKTYLKGKSSQSVQGVPYQVMREIARHRNFLNAQDSINQKSEEINQFFNINSLIEADKKKAQRRINIARKQINDSKKNLKLSKTNKELAPKVNDYKRKIRFNNDLIMALKFQKNLFEKSRKSFMRMKKRLSKRLNRETYVLREKAGKALAINLKRTSREMKKVLENNEFLRYEVFAGSGEVIRYKAAGGKSDAKNRLPASIKPQRTLTWSVTGEYWEDEIGNYRSALRNNCPKDQRRGLPPARARSARAN